MSESVKGVAAWFLGGAGFGALAATVLFKVTANECTVGTTSITYECVGNMNLEQFIAANGTGWAVVGVVLGWLISES